MLVINNDACISIANIKCSSLTKTKKNTKKKKKKKKERKMVDNTCGTQTKIKILLMIENQIKSNE